MEEHKGWSTTLFLRINKQIGERPRLDRLMLFFADDLVYFLVLLSLLWATTGLEAQGGHVLAAYLKLLMTAFIFGIGISWMIGFFLPNPRPIKRFPKIQQLIEPFGTWKSFPSDHTIGSFIVATVSILMGAPLFVGGVLYVMALAIGVGRVYVGVHEPRDIVGGIIIALTISWLSPILLLTITEPLYDVIKTIFV
jgi:undecaprenyl-diphosphatase